MVVIGITITIYTSYLRGTLYLNYYTYLTRGVIRVIRMPLLTVITVLLARLE